MIRLTREDGSEPQTFAFAPDTPIRIGRVEGNDVVLAVEHISSRHAQIRCSAGVYLLTDLGSTNGSVVLRDGQRLLLGPKGATEIALHDEDVLVLGDIEKAVRLRVHLGAEPTPSDALVPGTVVAVRARQETLAVSHRLTANHDTLRLLFELAQAINAAEDRDQVLRAIAQAALKAIPAAVDALVLTAESDGQLALHGEAHRGRGLSHTPHLPVCRQVRHSGEALLFGDPSGGGPSVSLADHGVGSGIAAPLLCRDVVSGVLQINCPPGRFELRVDHLDLAVVLAHHAAVALEKAELIARLRQAEERLRDENTFLRGRQPTNRLIADSPAMVKVVTELDRAAASDITVLLSGETGTGKEVAARYIHEHSRRRDSLLVAINCGALPESLLDSELFGHRKGAFTGASSDRKGVFEVAAGGTVFLDEIGETPPAVQVRLLRVLEEGKIRRVGDAIERPANVRIIAASNRDLTLLVQEGRFRQDLYYRLRVFPIRLPPLRERPEDVEAICRSYVTQFATQLGKRLGPLDPSFIAALRRYAFPGNVRELVNEIERAVVRVDEGEPLVADLLSEEVNAAAAAVNAEPCTSLRAQLAVAEREIIARTLDRCGAKKAAAAAELGLTRQGLVKKMERLGLR